MLLGGSICSTDKGSYKGPLFARKKSRNYGKLLLVLFLMLVTIFAWEQGRKYLPRLAGAIKENKIVRGLATEYFPKDTKK